MKIIQEHCKNGTEVWGDDSFTLFCQDEKNLLTLKALSAEGNIKVKYYDNSPYYVIMQSSAHLYFLSQEEKWKERVIGFVVGIASTVAAELIAYLILH